MQNENRKNRLFSSVPGFLPPCLVFSPSSPVQSRLVKTPSGAESTFETPSHRKKIAAVSALLGVFTKIYRKPLGENSKRENPLKHPLIVKKLPQFPPCLVKTPSSPVQSRLVKTPSGAESTFETPFHREKIAAIFIIQ
ncbi:MAG: hypothetical protein IPM98_01890 [Lewinellaceae bacterium]|nr:hypothetical protein [Lewinellaceae bacterium]